MMNIKDKDDEDEDQDDEDVDQDYEDEDETNWSENEIDFNDLETVNDASNGEPEIVESEDSSISC